MGEVVDDTTNITGIAALLAYGGSEDLDELEKSIVDGNVDKPSSRSEVDQFKDHMNRLGSIIGAPEIGDRNRDDADDDADDDDDDGDDDDTRSAWGNESNIGGMTSSSSFTPSSNISESNNFEHHTSQRTTEEQKRQSTIGSVMDNMNKSSDAFIEQALIDDDRAVMLEDIDTLMTNMKDMGVDLSRIPPMDSKSSMDDIRNIHKILRIKNDRINYSDFAEDVILGGAHVMEWAFDGKKEYLGRSPDLTGWHTTVNIKLRRMRYHTSTFVSDFMRSHRIDHGTRIVMELVPSLFTHTSTRKRQHGDTLVGSAKMSEAINAIRDIDETDE